MNEIYEILKELRPEFDFTDSEDFVEDGYLDSFDIISLVSTIEDKYSIKISGLDVLPENFCSVDAIVALIKKNHGNI
ncbi:MAG: acyl carrier protein [Lachnospiraceae bacterium]|jgi:acyl carrier protein|nr:acyl carrier protein [Lachnospiraceae bacterium]